MLKMVLDPHLMKIWRFQWDICYWCLHQPKWAQSCNSEDMARKTQFIMLDLCQNKMFTENTSIQKQFAQHPYFFNVTIHVIQAVWQACADCQSSARLISVSVGWNTGVNWVTCRILCTRILLLHFHMLSLYIVYGYVWHKLHCQT